MSPEDDPRPHAGRAFTYRNYRLFFGGQSISVVGTWMQRVAQAWLVWRLTGSVALLGAIGFASQIPVFLLSTIGGVVADRGSRRRILVATQVSAMTLGATMAALTLSGVIQVWEVFVAAVLLGVVNAFDVPTRQSFVLDMVPRPALQNAIALNSSLVNGARMIGPAIAGVLVGTVGEGWCFLIDAVSYLAVIGALLSMRDLPAVVRRPRASALAEIREGIHFAATSTPIRALLLYLGLMSLMGMSFRVLLPTFADRILDHGATGFGLLTAANALGALGAALSLARRRTLSGLGRVVAIAGIGFGVGLILFSWSSWFWVSMALMVPAGFGMMTQMASTNTLVQSMSPDHLRGRVMALYSTMFLGMAPFGALITGGLAGLIGPQWTVTVGGVACIAGGLAFAANLPALRPVARSLLDRTELPPPGAPSAGPGPGPA